MYDPLPQGPELNLNCSIRFDFNQVCLAPPAFKTWFLTIVSGVIDNQFFLTVSI